jgi:ferredoxin-type protein NapG
MACVTEKPAIFVLPHEVSQGKAGSHYVKGWDKEDEKRLVDAHSEETTTEISKKSPADYLNVEELY